MNDAENQDQAGEWPIHFPEVDCPPDDARELDDVVFYLVALSPPTADDFLSALERGAFKRFPVCERAALSCGLEMQYVERLREAVPRLRPMKIAMASLQPEQGRIRQTGNPGHHSMWLRRVALQNAPELFEVVE